MSSKLFESEIEQITLEWLKMRMIILSYMVQT